MRGDEAYKFLSEHMRWTHYCTLLEYTDIELSESCGLTAKWAISGDPHYNRLYGADALMKSVITLLDKEGRLPSAVQINDYEFEPELVDGCLFWAEKTEKIRITAHNIRDFGFQLPFSDIESGTLSIIYE